MLWPYIALSAALACRVLALQADGSAADFDAWLKQHNRKYASQEEEKERRAVFLKNLARINAWNARKESYTMAMNGMGDMTRQEYLARHARSRATKPERKRVNSTSSSLKQELVSLPDSLDWRLNGSVTGVKNQGDCGSCWSFSSTGAMEGAHQLQTGQLVSLSEQFLMDCEPTNLGCKGGLQPNCFDYVISKSHGIMSEADYPYTGDKNKCKSVLSKFVANFSSYGELNEGAEGQMPQAVVLHGPISAGMDAGGDGNFQFYKSGVFVSHDCTKVIDHAILVIGYGHDPASGLDYWLVKNSWGADWGMEGYFWIEKGKNMCGIAEYVSYIIA